MSVGTSQMIIKLSKIVKVISNAKYSVCVQASQMTVKLNKMVEEGMA